MASQDKKESDSDDGVSKHVLEYYQKYSQNRDLCKFFTGSSISYIPETVIESEKEETIEDEQVIDISRASSALSNHRKLEWDNGADIGYDNCQKLRKCSSLPVLLNTKKPATSRNDKVEIVLVPYNSDSDMEQVKQVSSSSSSAPIEQKYTKSTTTSSSAPEIEKTVLTSSSSSETVPSMSYVYQKINFPMAHSTPKLPIEEFVPKSDGEFKSSSLDTIFTKKLKGKFKKHSFDNVSAEYPDIFVKNTNPNLIISKPVTVECLDNGKKTTKNVQTITVDQYSKSTQTNIDRARKSSKDNQIICFIEHSETDKSEIESNCDSFEFIKGDSKPKAAKEEQNIETQESNKNANEQIRSYYPNIAPQTSVSAETSASSFSFDEIEQHLNVLQRLLKSKKYDSTTKKHYMKKILKKISQSEENSRTSTSSELFQPKQSAEKFPTTQKITSTSDSSDSKIAENLKWYPIKKLTTKILTQTENNSSKENSDIKAEIIPRNRKKLTRFTLTNNEFSINPGESNRSPSDDFNTMPKNNYSGCEGVISSGSYNNWKDDKTMSEKLLEEDKFGGKGDYILECAKKERNQQLKWINNEISHLNKLKCLLEKPNSSENSDNTPTMINSQNPRKTTTTYKVSSKDNVKPRKYVIETELGDEPAPKIMDFVLGSEKYTVAHLENNSEMGKKRNNIQSEIKITSNNSTTELKIRTLCKICLKTPCECISKDYKNVTCFVCMKGECSCSPFCGSCLRNPCPKCRRILCLCRCFCCQRNPCVCSTRSNTYPKEKACCTCGKSQTLAQNAQTDVRKPCLRNPCSECRRTLCLCRCFWCQRNPCICTTRSNTYPKEKPCCNCDKKRVESNEIAIQTSLIEQEQINRQNIKSQTSTKTIYTNVNENALQTGLIDRKDSNKTQTSSSPKSSPLNSMGNENAIQNELLRSKGSDNTQISSSALNSMEDEVQTSSAEPNMEQQTDKSQMSSSTTNSIVVESSKSSIFSNPSSESSSIMCACCKKKEANENMSLLISKHRYHLCHTCLNKNPGVATIYYDSAEHICTCYTEVNAENLKKYNNKLETKLETKSKEYGKANRLDNMTKLETKSKEYEKDNKLDNMTKLETRSKEYETNEFCTCLKPTPMKNSNCCSYCQCKLKKTARSKNGIAYTLTLEPGSPAASLKTPVKKPLEEIRIKVPCPDKKKKRKNIENLTKKVDKGVEISVTNPSKSSDISNERTDKNRNTLQDYLNLNRPDFVNSAESRRKILLNSMDQRIENKDDVKLKFYENNLNKINNKETNRLFTAKEMKEINRKNYKKIPEVKEKLNKRKEQQIKDANKLIVSLFTKKLQCCVLKGKKNFPIDVNVINLACTNK